MLMDVTDSSFGLGYEMMTEEVDAVTEVNGGELSTKKKK